MSKKIAEGTGALVLDVKVGSGAFMKDVDQRPRARRDDGRARHRRRRDDGRAAHRHVHPARPDGGQRASRSRESVEVLAGGGPADVVELTLALAREMLRCRRRRRRRPGRPAARRLGDGRLAADDRRPGRRPRRRRCRRPGRRTCVTAPRTGVLTRLDAMAVGLAAWRLGAGRARKEDPVQAGAGVVMHAKPGDTVTEGQPLLTPAHRRAGAVRAGAGRPRRRRRVRRPGSSYDAVQLVIDRVAG